MDGSRESQLSLWIQASYSCPPGNKPFTNPLSVWLVITLFVTLNLYLSFSPLFGKNLSLSW